MSNPKNDFKNADITDPETIEVTDELKNVFWTITPTHYEVFLLSINKYSEALTSIETPANLSEPDKKKITALRNKKCIIEESLKASGREGLDIYKTKFDQERFKFSPNQLSKEELEIIEKETLKMISDGDNTGLIVIDEYRNAEVRLDLRGLLFLHGVKKGKQNQNRKGYNQQIKSLKQKSPFELILLERQAQRDYINWYNEKIEAIKKIETEINQIITEYTKSLESKGLEIGRIYNSKITNALQYTNQADINKAEKTGNNIIEKKGYKLDFGKGEILAGFNTFVLRYLWFGDMKLTEINSKSKDAPINDQIKFSLREFMEFAKLESISKAKEKLKNSLITLNARLQYSEGKEIWKMTSIVFKSEIKKVKNNIENNKDEDYNVIVQYDREYIEQVIKSGFLTEFSKRVIKEIDYQKCPDSLSYYRQILVNSRMNKGKSNENIVSIKSLLGDRALTSNSHYKREIIEPFEKNLNALAYAFSWEYIHEKKTIIDPLPDVFKKTNIKITWKGKQ